jgi:hypothetical protein
MQFQATLYRPRKPGDPREKIASWRVQAETLQLAVEQVVKPIKATTAKGPDIIWPVNGELDVQPIIP